MRVKGLRHADLTQRAQRATPPHGQRAHACVTTSGALTIAIANTYRPQPTNPQPATRERLFPVPLDRSWVLPREFDESPHDLRIEVCARSRLKVLEDAIDLPGGPVRARG